MSTKERPSAAGRCLAVATLYVVDTVLGVIVGGVLGLVLACVPLMFGGPADEGTGYVLAAGSVIGGLVGLVVGLVVASHESKGM